MLAGLAVALNVRYRLKADPAGLGVGATRDDRIEPWS
jgi:hypothetical protein